MGIRTWIESRAFYFPSRAIGPAPVWAQDVMLPGPRGSQLNAWFLRAHGSMPGGRLPAVLHVHGNAGNIESHVEFSRWLTRHGFHVLASDYRGFGRSSPAARGLRREDLLDDTRAAWACLIRRPEVDPERCAVLGVSLGGVLGLALAADDERVRAAVAVAAFSGWRTIAREKAGWPGALLVRPGLDAVESVGRFRRSLLVVHGDRDTIVPPRHAVAIAHQARRGGARVEELLLPNAGHNDILIDDAAAQSRVAGFLHEAIATA